MEHKEAMNILQELVKKDILTDSEREAVITADDRKPGDLTFFSLLTFYLCLCLVHREMDKLAFTTHRSAVRIRSSPPGHQRGAGMRVGSFFNWKGP